MQETVSARAQIVVVVASLGGVQALAQLLSGLPADFPLPVVVVQHRTGQLPNLLRDVLARHTRLRIENAVEGEALTAGTVYIAPPNRHVAVTPDRRLSLRDGRRIKHVRSSGDPLFESAAAAYGGGTIAVVLSGVDGDGTEGALAVKDAGGTVIAQDKATSQSFAMPHSAIAAGVVDAVLPIGQIAPALRRLAARN